MDYDLKEFVTVESYYTTQDGKVMEHWRPNGGKWRVVETPYDNVPYIIIDRIPADEFSKKYRRR